MTLTEILFKGIDVSAELNESSFREDGGKAQAQKGAQGSQAERQCTIMPHG